MVGLMRMGLGKPTEMTLQDLLVEELKRRGVVVVPEVSFRTVDGRRLVPDLVLHDGAQYVVETKLGAETKPIVAELSCSITHVRLNKPKRRF
jgi:hypothetical protein